MVGRLLAAGILTTMLLGAGCGDDDASNTDDAPGTTATSVQGAPSTAELDEAMCTAAAGGPDDEVVRLIFALHLPDETALGYRLGDLVESAVQHCPDQADTLPYLADELYSRLGVQHGTGNALPTTTTPVD